MTLTDPQHRALIELLTTLGRQQYCFVTPTPATHATVLARHPQREAHAITDILGWSLPFRREAIDPQIIALLYSAKALSRTADGQWRADIRVSTVANNLFIHSAFPTDAQDAVFLGPDSYRFAAAIAAELACKGLRPDAAICDIGTGSGVGAIVVGRAWPDATITMTDINPQALEYARINAAAAGVTARAVVASDLANVPGPLDLVLANPPYIVDVARRAYRDGGGAHGSQVALEMTAMALAELAPHGRFLLYTGSAIVAGEDRLQQRLQQFAADAGCTLRYCEIDPDVFGEELANPAYDDVDRIAVVVGIFTKAAS